MLIIECNWEGAASWHLRATNELLLQGRHKFHNTNWRLLHTISSTSHQRKPWRWLSKIFKRCRLWIDKYVECRGPRHQWQENVEHRFKTDFNCRSAAGHFKCRQQSKRRKLCTHIVLHEQHYDTRGSYNRTNSRDWVYMVARSALQRYLRRINESIIARLWWNIVHRVSKCELDLPECHFIQSVEQSAHASSLRGHELRHGRERLQNSGRNRRLIHAQSWPNIGDVFRWALQHRNARSWDQSICILGQDPRIGLQ